MLLFQVTIGRPLFGGHHNGILLFTDFFFFLQFFLVYFKKNYSFCLRTTLKNFTKQLFCWGPHIQLIFQTSASPNQFLIFTLCQNLKHFLKLQNFKTLPKTLFEVFERNVGSYFCTQTPPSLPSQIHSLAITCIKVWC